jgi:uncharacterized membrane protein YedE/YeeE
MMAADNGSSPFNPRLIFGIVAGGIAAFVAFLLLATYADDLGTARDPRAHALSVGATGFQGLVRLIGHAGGEARMVRSWEELESEDLLVVTVEERSDPDLLAEIVEQRGGRATLLILPKWIAVPEENRPGWVRSEGMEDPEALQQLLQGIAQVDIIRAGNRVPRRVVGQEYLEGVEATAPTQAQAVSGEAVIPLIPGPGGSAVLARIGERALYLLADPDLMNNHGLATAETAQVALAILAGLNTTGAEAVHFDLMLSGHGQQPSSLKLLFEPPFLALTLALFVAALLAGLHGSVRFGPVVEEERAIGFGKAALVENSASLIQLARREHKAGAAYAELVRESAARAVGAPHELRGEALDAYLDRLSPAERPFSTLAAAASAATDRHQLISAARALFNWKKEMTQ